MASLFMAVLLKKIYVMPVKAHGEAIAIISINDLDGLTWRQALAIGLGCNLLAPILYDLEK